MLNDKHGLEITAANGDAVGHYDATLSAFLGLARDVGDHLKRTLDADRDMALALCMRGYFMLLFCNPVLAPKARKARDAARAAIEARGGTARERRHVDVLSRWLDGDLGGATDAWERILLDCPRDMLALCLAHFTHFYSGDGRAMVGSVARVLHAWHDDAPDHGFLLGLHAFGLEESGDYVRAEELGRRAVDINPADIWAVHAVAHVLEMQGRQHDGIAWLTGSQESWAGANNFAYHVWWHRCLYHLDLGDFDAVLTLYDDEVRADRESTDYLDISNAAALLWRLEAHGVAVGARWFELADKSERRVDDHLLAFADAHFMLALAAEGREAAAETMLRSMRAAAEDGGSQGAVFKEVGLALCEAIWALGRGAHGEAVDLLHPVRARLWRIGGSHAQRDLFDQMLIEAALGAGRLPLARALLSERTAARPNSGWGWGRYAEALDGLGDTDGAAAARGQQSAL